MGLLMAIMASDVVPVTGPVAQLQQERHAESTEQGSWVKLGDLDGWLGLLQLPHVPNASYRGMHRMLHNIIANCADSRSQLMSLPPLLASSVASLALLGV